MSATLASSGGVQGPCSVSASYSPSRRPSATEAVSNAARPDMKSRSAYEPICASSSSVLVSVMVMAAS
jgi:hypothetical protein